MGLPTSSTQALRLLDIAQTDVSEVQTISAQLLELLAVGSAAHHFPEKVLSLTDALREAAGNADAAFKKASTLPPSDTLAAGTFLEEQQRARKELEGCSVGGDTSGSQLTLSQLVQQVADVCGLEVRLVAHARNVSSLLEQAPATHGVKPEEATEVWVLIPDVLRAAVALSGPGEARAVTAAVYGPEEVCTTDRDAWGISDHVVFRRISAVAIRAINYFERQAEAEGCSFAPALQSLLLWLCSYRNLFERRCEASGMLLVADTTTQHLLPPLVRPYHVAKDSMLDAAANGASAAYHMQAAPASVL